MTGEAAEQRAAPVAVPRATADSAAASRRAKHAPSPAATALMRWEAIGGGERLRARTGTAPEKAGLSEEKRQGKAKEALPAANLHGEEDSMVAGKSEQRKEAANPPAVRSHRKYLMAITSQPAGAAATAKKVTASNAAAKEEATATTDAAGIAAAAFPPAASSHDARTTAMVQSSSFECRIKREANTAIHSTEGSCGGTEDDSSRRSVNACSSNNQINLSEAWALPTASGSCSRIANESCISVSTEWLPSAPDSNPPATISLKSTRRILSVSAVAATLNATASAAARPAAALPRAPAALPPAASAHFTGDVIHSSPTTCAPVAGAGDMKEYRPIERAQRTQQQLQQASLDVEEEDAQQQQDSGYRKRMGVISPLTKQQQQRQQHTACVNKQEHQHKQHLFRPAAGSFLPYLEGAYPSPQVCLSSNHSSSVASHCTLEEVEGKAAAVASTAAPDAFYTAVPTSATRMGIPSEERTVDVALYHLMTPLGAQVQALSAPAAGKEAALAVDGSVTGTAAASTECRRTVEKTEAEERSTTDAIGAVAETAAARTARKITPVSLELSAARHTNCLLEASVDRARLLNKEGCVASLLRESKRETKQAAKATGAALQGDGVHVAGSYERALSTTAVSDTVAVKAFAGHPREGRDSAAQISKPSVAVSAADTAVGRECTESLSCIEEASDVFSKGCLDTVAHVTARAAAVGFPCRDAMAVESSKTAATLLCDPASSRVYVAANNSSGTHNEDCRSRNSSRQHQRNSSCDRWLPFASCGKSKSVTESSDSGKKNLRCKSGSTTTHSICSRSSIESSKETCSRDTSNNPNVTCSSSEAGERSGNSSRRCSRESLRSSTSTCRLMGSSHGSDEAGDQIRSNSSKEARGKNQQEKKKETNKQQIILAQTLQQHAVQLSAEEETVVLHREQLEAETAAATVDPQASDYRTNNHTHTCLQQEGCATAAIAAAVVAVAAGKKPTLEPLLQSAASSALPAEDQRPACDPLVPAVAANVLPPIFPINTSTAAAAGTSDSQRNAAAYVSLEEVLVAATTMRNRGSGATANETATAISEDVPAASSETPAVPVQGPAVAARGHRECGCCAAAACDTLPTLDDALIVEALLGSSSVALSAEALTTFLLQKRQLLQVMQQLLLDQQHHKISPLLQLHGQEQQEQQHHEKQQQYQQGQQEQDQHEQDQQQQATHLCQQHEQAWAALLEQQSGLMDLLLQQHSYAMQLPRLQQQQELEKLLRQQQLQAQKADKHILTVSRTLGRSMMFSGSLPSPSPRTTSSNPISSDDSSRDSSKHGDCGSDRSSKCRSGGLLHAGIYWSQEEQAASAPLGNDNNLLQGESGRVASPAAVVLKSTTSGGQTPKEQAVAAMKSAVAAACPPTPAPAISGGGPAVDSDTLCISHFGEKAVDGQDAVAAATVEQRSTLPFVGDLSTAAGVSTKQNAFVHSSQRVPEAAEAEYQLLLNSLCELPPAATAANPSRHPVDLHEACIATVAAAENASQHISLYSAGGRYPQPRENTVPQLQENKREVAFPVTKRLRREVSGEAVPALSASAAAGATEHDAALTAALRRTMLADAAPATRGRFAGVTSTSWNTVTRAAHGRRTTAAASGRALAVAKTAAGTLYGRAGVPLKRKKEDPNTVDYAVRARACERVSGVCFDRWNQGWIATWRKQRRPVHKHYSVKKYGFEQARLLAIRHRCCMVLQQQQEQQQKDQQQQKEDNHNQQKQRGGEKQVFTLRHKNQLQQVRWSLRNQQELQLRQWDQKQHELLQHSQTKVESESVCNPDDLKWASFFCLASHHDDPAAQPPTDCAAVAAVASTEQASPGVSAAATSPTGASLDLSALQHLNYAAGTTAAATKLIPAVAAADAARSNASISGSAAAQTSFLRAADEGTQHREMETADTEVQHVRLLEAEAPMNAAALALSTPVQEVPAARPRTSVAGQVLAAASPSVEVEAAAAATLRIQAAAALKRGVACMRGRTPTAHTLTKEEEDTAASFSGIAGTTTRRRLAAETPTATATRCLRSTKTETCLHQLATPQQRHAVSEAGPFCSSSVATRLEAQQQPQQETGEGWTDIGTLVATMPKVERVSFDFTNHSWIAQWKQHGSATYRRFAVSKFGFYGAFRLAVLYKEQHYRPTALPSTRASASGATADGESLAPTQRRRRGAGGGACRSTKYRQQWQRQRQQQKTCKQQQEQQDEKWRSHVEEADEEKESQELQDAYGTQAKLLQQQQGSEGHREQQQQQPARQKRKKAGIQTRQFPLAEQQQRVPRQGERCHRGDHERGQEHMQDWAAGGHQQRKEDEIYQKELEQLHSFNYFGKEENLKSLWPESEKKRVQLTDAVPARDTEGGFVSPAAELSRAEHPGAAALVYIRGHGRTHKAVDEEDGRMTDSEEGRQRAFGRLPKRYGGNELADHSNNRSQNLLYTSSDFTKAALEKTVKTESSAKAVLDEAGVTTEGEVNVVPPVVPLDAGTNDLLQLAAAGSAGGGDGCVSTAGQMSPYLQYLLSHSSLPLQAGPEQRRHQVEDNFMPLLQRQPQTEETSWPPLPQQQNRARNEDAAAAAQPMDDTDAGSEAPLFMLPPLAYPLTYNNGTVTAHFPGGRADTYPPAAALIDDPAVACTLPAVSTPTYAADPTLLIAATASSTRESPLSEPSTRTTASAETKSPFALAIEKTLLRKSWSS